MKEVSTTEEISPGPVGAPAVLVPLRLAQSIILRLMGQVLPCTHFLEPYILILRIM